MFEIPALSTSVASGLIMQRPSVLDDSGTPEPENSEIRKIANDVLQALQYSFVAVAANPNAQVRDDSVEAVFQEAIAKIPETRRSAIEGKAATLANADQRVRTTVFGRYGQIDSSAFVANGFDRAHEGLPELEIDAKLLGIRVPSVTVPVSAVRVENGNMVVPAELRPGGFEDFEEAANASVESAVDSKVIDEERVQDIWGPVYEGDPYMEAGEGFEEEFEEQAVTDKLGLWITRVKCVDETNPEWWGSDEIAMGGVSVDEDGDTKKIGERYIGGGFDDGDQKKYSPHWRYHWFSMRESAHWPKSYRIAMTLAEKDHGGFESFLNEVWKHVKDRVKAAVEKAVTGALTGYLGPVIAAAIGKAVAWIIGVLVGWIISWFGDDIFPVFTASCTVPSFGARWYYPNGTWGSTTSGIRAAHFYGHGGHYLVNYYWKLFS